MNKIYLVEAGIDYEGHSALKAFLTKEAAEEFAATCRAYLATAQPYLDRGYTRDEMGAWYAAESAWEQGSPDPKNITRHIDYFEVIEVEFVGEQP